MEHYAIQTYTSVLHLEESVGSGGMVIRKYGNGNIGQDTPSLALFHLDPHILQLRGQSPLDFESNALTTRPSVPQRSVSL